MLLIDDEADIGVAVGALLASEGIALQAVADEAGARAAMAQAQASGQPFDLLMSDYRLAHGVDGVELAMRLRAELMPNLPLLIITGETAPERLQRIHDLRLAVLFKPVAAPRLMEALRSAMRQAPDCILIGEIRDRETMAAALAYAQTGHLCLATLHANNAYHALNRIFSFFPMDGRTLLSLDLAATLKCIISQRLVKRPDGGRIPAVEILLNSRQVAELIERSEISAIREAMEQSLAQGSRTFEQDLFRLYKDKAITLEEALANSDSPTNLSWLINNAQFGNGNAEKAAKPPSGIDFETTNPDGSSFREFTLELDND